MKSTLTLFLFVVLAAGIASAQVIPQVATEVTFGVDMTGVPEFDPAVDTIRVAGNFQGYAPRDPSNVNIMQDEDGDSVYTVVLPIPENEFTKDTVYFKYVINSWADGTGRTANEFEEATQGVRGDCLEPKWAEPDNNGNRTEIIPLDSGAYALPVYKYNTCDISTISGIQTFRQLRGVSVSPNPMGNHTTLSLPAQAVGSYSIRVLGADGRLISQAQEFTGTSYDIERGNLVSGIYLIEVINSSASERAVLRLSVE